MAFCQPFSLIFVKDFLCFYIKGRWQYNQNRKRIRCSIISLNLVDVFGASADNISVLEKKLLDSNIRKEKGCVTRLLFL